MAEDQNRTLQDKFMLRLPDGMRDRIRQAAESNNRSMNAEIISLLEWALDHDDQAAPADPSPVMLKDILAEIAGLRAELVEVRQVGGKTEVTYARPNEAGGEKP